MLGSEHPYLGVVVSTLAQYEHGKLSSSFVTSLSPPPPHDRDHQEEAFVSLNGEVCWSKRIFKWRKFDGAQECGRNFDNPSNPYSCLTIIDKRRIKTFFFCVQQVLPQLRLSSYPKKIHEHVLKYKIQLSYRLKLNTYVEKWTYF